MRQPEPGERALARARAKALAVPRADGEIALGADQVAFDPATGECFGKPRDDEDHAARLRALRGREHQLFTAYCVVGPSGERAGVAVARVHLRADVEDAEIDRYVACGEARGCAGGYAVEGRGAFLIGHIDGDWTGVLGLPLYDVLGALRALGWRFDG